MRSQPSHARKLAVVDRAAHTGLLLLAFGLRAAFVPVVRQDFDRAVPLASGIAWVQALLAGDATVVPAQPFGTSVGLPNPPLANLFWALIGLLDRGPYAATTVAALLGTLAVAMGTNLARRLLGPSAAWFAGALMAASPWSVFFGVATWLQGQLEFMAVCVCWLLLGGAAAGSRRRVLAALLCCGAFMQWYLPVMALLPMAALCGLIALPPVLRRPLVLGAGIAAAGALAFVIFVMWLAPTTVQAGARAPAAFTEGSTHGFGHSLRIMQGRGFEVNMLYEKYAAEVRAAPGYVTQFALGEARAWAGDALFAIGTLLLLGGLLRPAGSHRLGLALMTWMGLPPLLAMLLAIRDPSWPIHPHYMAITAPAGYLIAAAPLAWLQHRRPSLARWAALLAALLAAMTGATRLQYHAAYVRAYPWFRSIEHVPLADQTRLHAHLRGMCDQLITDQDARWTASLWRDVRTSHTLERALPQLGVARNGHYFRAHKPGERWCVAGVPAPVDGLVAAPLALAGGDEVPIWRTPVIEPSNPQNLTSNIGWRLLAANTPHRVARGTVARIEHIWQIEALPAEPHATWYYAPFIKLFDSTGRELLMVNGAPGLEGKDWREGDHLDSVIALRIPPSLPPGDYTLRLSLFDPNQAKNAAYFDAAGNPILEITRPLTIDD